MLKEKYYSTKDNHCPQSQIPQPVVEENKKWRCTKMNNGEHDSLAIISPHPKTGEGVLSRLSENEEITPKPCQNKSSTQIHPRYYKAFFVRLAEESPKRNCDEQSDSSMYGSFNCLETDICRDSSDTDSNSSFTSGDIETTIKVVEYEVATASNSEDLFSNDSSSGTEDFFLAAVARAICDTSKCSSDFADTEDSSNTNDSEFSSADYWVCVKCKNKQNNPMFRYCEKCYQIRKTHFPPRPRLRRSRSTIKRNRTQLSFPSIQRSATISEMNEKTKRKRKEEIHKGTVNPITPTSSSNSPKNGLLSEPGRLLVGIPQNQFDITAQSSSDDDNTESQFYRHPNGNPNGDDFKETPYSRCFPSAGTTDKVCEQIPTQRFRMAAKRKAQTKYKTSAKRKCEEQVAVPARAPSDTESETDFVLSQSICGSTQGTQKDSGFSSAPSSQERKSSSEQQNDDDCHLLDVGDGAESSDTVCGELNDSDVAEMSQENTCFPNSLEYDLNSQEHSLGRRVSDIVPQSTTEQHTISPLVQSVSECSDAYTNTKASPSNPELLKISSFKKNKLASLQPLIGRSTENGDFSSYGSCMTCLTEPKNGVFVHSRFLHLCCCYKCAVKIWNKSKKCPICNCAVKNVMKLFVH